MPTQKPRTRAFTVPAPWLAAILAAALLTGGCGGAPSTSPDADSESTAEAQPDDRDPLEPFNRAMLKFNFKVDRYALKPVAKAYQKLPQPVRNGVGNFFFNLSLPGTIVNDLLQGKLAQAGRDSGRFVINTTLGLFGLIDVASKMGLPRHREDFGQTLAKWGVPAGPYLVLPFLGPSNLRDTTGLVADNVYTDPLNELDSPEREYATALRIVNIRANLLGLDEVLEVQPDKYLFLREGYRQRRLSQIHDGAPPAGADGVSDDELLDELLEEEEEWD